MAPAANLHNRVVGGAPEGGLQVGPPDLPAGVVAEPLLDEPLLVYAIDDAHVGAPDTWGPWVAFPSGSHTRSVIATALAAAGARFEVVAESNQPEVLREMVRLGLGWAVLPAVQAEPGADPLVPARPAPLAVRQLVLARRADVPPDATADALVEALRSDALAPSRATSGR